MEKPNTLLGKLVKVKHLNKVGTIINYIKAYDCYVVNLGNNINNIYALTQLIFLDDTLNNPSKGFECLSDEELSELLMEQNEQK